MTDHLPAILAERLRTDGPYDREEQLVRADGTVIVSWMVPGGMAVQWFPDLGCGIVGPCFGRVRILERGQEPSEWYVIASFPYGYPGPMEWSQEMPPSMQVHAELEWVE